MSDKFTKSDGCLLVTIWCSGKKINLKSWQIIGNLINHATFSFDEINEGLSRLESDGYIFFKKRKIYLTPKAKCFIKEHKSRFEKIISFQVKISNIFCELPLNSPTTYKEYISLEIYNDVMKKYY